MSDTLLLAILAVLKEYERARPVTCQKCKRDYTKEAIWVDEGLDVAMENLAKAVGRDRS